MDVFSAGELLDLPELPLACATPSGSWEAAMSAEWAELLASFVPELMMRMWQEGRHVVFRADEVTPELKQGVETFLQPWLAVNQGWVELKTERLGFENASVSYSIIRVLCRLPGTQRLERAVEIMPPIALQLIYGCSGLLDVYVKPGVVTVLGTDVAHVLARGLMECADQDAAGGGSGPVKSADHIISGLHRGIISLQHPVTQESCKHVVHCLSQGWNIDEATVARYGRLIGDVVAGRTEVAGDAGASAAPAGARAEAPNECDVCCEPSGRQRIRLDCGHEFHGCCIVLWDFNGASNRAGGVQCPLCRVPISLRD